MEGATMKSDRGRQEGAASASRGRERGQEMRNRKQRRPKLEALESRRLLTTINDSFLPSTPVSPQGITAGPPGTIWFTAGPASGQQGYVGMINTATGAMSPMIPVGAAPQGII